MSKLFFKTAIFVGAMAFGGSLAQAKSTIVLVHGAFQSAEGWKAVKGSLEQKGFKVIAVDLPGRDGDSTPIEKISSDLYRSTIMRAIEGEKGVVLVGHSFGGIQITNVAESEPTKIRSLVYLSAYLPKNGESLQALAQADKDSVLAIPGNFVMSPDYKYASIKEDAKASAFANDANEEMKKQIVASLIQEPLAPQATPVAVSEAKFGKVAKYYIETTEDHCVSPALQERMQKSAKLKKVFKLAAGHASYITQPEKVASILAEIAGK